MTDNPLWERLPSDTDKSYEAFCVYRDMGANRSHTKVAQELSKSVALIHRWSSDHDWINRVSAYDDYMRDMLRQQNEAKRVQIQADALSDYDAIRKAIDKRIRVLEEVDYQSSTSDLHDLISLMEHANAYARLNSGLPDRITENNNRQSGNLKVTHDIPQLPDSILDKLNLDDSD